MIFKRNRPAASRAKRSARNLQSFLDEESIGDLTVDQLEKHLELCRRCGLEADAYRSIKSSLAQVGKANENASTLQRLRAFGQQLVDEEPPSTDEPSDA